MIKGLITNVTDGDYQKVVNGIGRPNEEINSRSYFQHTGFTSLPKANSRGIFIVDGENVTCIASADALADRPALSNEKDVAVYSDSDNYMKIDGDTDNIRINSEGNIEIGIATFSKVLVEAAKTLYNNHGHDYVVSGAPFITGKPTTSIIAALVPAPMGNAHMSTVVEVT